MSLRMLGRSAFVALFGFLTIALGVRTSAAQGLTELPGIINLMTPGASVTDPQGVIWSEGTGGEGGGTGVFAPFLREQQDSVENAFNTDYLPTPLDGKPGSFTHSLTFGSLATVTVGGTDYYSFRLDANESGGDERLALDDLRIYSAAGPAIPDYATLVSSGSLLYAMPADQFVLLDTANHPGSGTSDMTVLIPTSYFSSTSSGSYLYLYNSFGDCACDSFHTSGGFEEWSAMQTAAPDQAPSVTAPLAVNGEEGGTLSFGVTASDPDGDAISSLSANLTSLPEGNDAAFTPNENNTAGTFLWHMGVGEAGSYDVTFTATANDLSSSSTTQVDVRPAGTNVTGVFTWTPKAGEEGVYEIVFSATDEGGTSTLPWTITVESPSGAAAPSAPLSLRAPGVALAPQAPQKGPIISGTGSTSVGTGSTATVSVSGSTDYSSGASVVLRASRISRAASAAQTTTLTCDTSALPSGNDAQFVVDNQPVIGGPSTMTASPGAPMTLTRTATDPDGDAIESFTADLSALPSGNPGTFTVDGTNTTGTLTWTPRLADVGTYNVTFTAFNELVGTGSTTITVGAAAAARVFVMDPVKINIGSSRPINCVYIEPIDGSFSLTDVDVATVKMISTGTGVVSEISAITGKPTLIADRDYNLIPDLGVCFTKADLRLLFGHLSGKTTVTVQIEGRLVNGAFFAGTATVEVIANGPAVGSASIAPNPLNPQAKLSLMLGKGGWLRVTLYDMQGRLVRELANEQNVAPGPREITIDGMDSKGLPLASGVYYFRVQSADGVHNGRLAIVR
jgi:hypothetical protein